MAEQKIEIGRLLVLGRYGGESILWRCVDIDENGPLFLADKPLCVKAFDAAGNHTYSDGTPQADRGGYRTAIGSNLWETSNLRAWLNSSAPAGETAWPDGCPPSPENLWNRPDAYAKEEGFLSESHFSESERAVMKTVIQDCLLNDADLDKYGKETLRAFSAVVDVDVEKRIQERITMYAHKVADRVFLLDVLQQSRARLQAGVPGMCCWLRTPLTRLSDPSAVLIVKKDGDIGYCTASSAHVGVRPAFYLDQAVALPCKPQVRILGVGTAGIRILNRMIDDCGDSGEYLAIDQDPSALENSRTKDRIWARERRRIGLGSDPLSVPESIADVAGEITESVRGARLVVLTGGLGRVFGTNALPMIAQIVKDTNWEGVVAAIVTKPFHFEKHSVRIAEEGARRLLPCVDCLILIQDDDLLEEMDRKHTTLSEAFKIADQTVVRAIRCVADAVSRSGIVSPDPSEIFEILRHAGTAEFGTGAAGVGRPIDEAIQNVFCSRPLGISDHPADKVLLRLSCSDGISFQELAGALESAQRTLGNRTEFYCSVHIGEIPYGFTEASAVAFWD